MGCKNNSSKPDLASLDLLRGKLQLCGNGQFGDVSFSESCTYETRETFNLAIARLGCTNHKLQFTVRVGEDLYILSPSLLPTSPPPGERGVTP